MYYPPMAITPRANYMKGHDEDRSRDMAGKSHVRLSGVFAAHGLMSVGLMSFGLVAFGLMPAVSAQASDARPQPNWTNPAPAFKDLPGVVPEEARVRKEAADSPDCTTGVEFRRWRSDSILGSDSLPVQVYRCEQGGFTYSGTQMPNRPWVPGLNPYDLPRD
jgi:hypothetical protein